MHITHCINVIASVVMRLLLAIMWLQLKVFSATGVAKKGGKFVEVPDVEALDVEVLD